MPLITPLYAGLIALLFLWLSIRVMQGRFLHRVSVGDAGIKDMTKRMRVQANCAEYAPLGLILLALAELQGMPGWLVHVFGLTLLTGRCLHAWGFGRTPQIVLVRRLGIGLTVGMIAAVALANIAHALF